MANRSNKLDENLPTKKRILRVSERLFAIHGIDGVSLRSICSEVGQKNKTAAQYHFGNKEGLIKAILLDRMMTINLQRQQLLDEIDIPRKGVNPTKAVAAKRKDRSDDGKVDLHQLVEVLYRPFVQQLLNKDGGIYYVQFAAQLFSQGKGITILSDPQLQSATQQQLFVLITNKLEFLPVPVQMHRLSLMAGLMVQATATKAHELVSLDPKLHEHHIEIFCRDLIRFVVGGLMAPTVQPQDK